jgi:transcription initiation factor IIE alpha subunit
MHEITEREIKEKIKEILNFVGLILPDHVKKRMKQRNYSVRDIIYILRNADTVKFNKKGKDNYHCEVFGNDIEGDSCKIVMDIIKNKNISLITVI